MEITIKINGRFMSVALSTEVADYLEQAKRNNRKLYRERQRYWDGQEYDEYIIAAEGRLPYCVTPEELVSQRETLAEILAVLALCTPTQRERFLLYCQVVRRGEAHPANDRRRQLPLCNGDGEISERPSGAGTNRGSPCRQPYAGDLGETPAHAYRHELPGGL